MEQLLIRGLPAGTKARLDVLARRNGRSREAEVRVILDQALRLEPVSLADLLAMPESGGIEFEPGRLAGPRQSLSFFVLARGFVGVG